MPAGNAPLANHRTDVALLQAAMPRLRNGHVVVIHTGDCIEVMATMPAESVDAIVTDPPAGISFMSKHWDRDKGGRTEWVAWMTEVMVECYRVLKPGGYAVVWSLPRTCHWTAWAMEDAGFIIRDQLAHIFASGFPKGKAQLKPAREDWWLARKPGPLRPLGIDECRIGTEQTVTIRSGHSGDHGKFGQDNRTFERVNDGRWPSNVLLSDPELFDQPNPYVVGSGATAGSVNKDFGQSGYRRGGGDGPSVGLAGSKNAPDSYGDTGGYSRFFKIPETGRDGFYGNAVGDSRFSGLPSDSIDRGSAGGTQDRPSNSESSSGRDSGGRLEDGDAEARPAGSGAGGSEDGRAVDIELHAGDEALADYPSHFLIPKADRADREPVLRPDGHEAGKRFSTHPTVKPTDLMRHLVRLVTPSGGTVLDPFLGSGSTAIACELEGFPWIGIEKESEYVAIAEARLNGVQRGLGLDVGAPTRRDIGKQRGNKDEDGRPTLKGPANLESSWFHSEPDEEPAA